MMRKQPWPIWIIIAISFLLVVFLFETTERKNTGTTLVIGGGPQGSSAQNVAEEIAFILNRSNDTISFRAKQSAGSFDNLVGIEKGKLNFALANAEDSYNRLHNRTAGETPAQQATVLMVRLFGSYVQLIVPKSSPVKTPEDLRNRRIAIGSPGSDSAIVARRYFQALGLWDQLTPIFVGYERALQELIEGSVEAVWFMSGAPSEAVREVNRNHPLRLVNLWDGVPTSDASKKFYRDFPFYDIAVLRPNIYRDQNDTVFTIGMATLWFCNKNLSNELVYQSLVTVFDANNLQQIHTKYPATEEMNIVNTLTKMPLPMHPAAVKFLRDHL